MKKSKTSAPEQSAEMIYNEYTGRDIKSTGKAAKDLLEQRKHDKYLDETTNRLKFASDEIQDGKIYDKYLKKWYGYRTMHAQVYLKVRQEVKQREENEEYKKQLETKLAESSAVFYRNHRSAERQRNQEPIFRREFPFEGDEARMLIEPYLEKGRAIDPRLCPTNFTMANKEYCRTEWRKWVPTLSFMKPTITLSGNEKVNIVSIRIELAPFDSRNKYWIQPALRNETEPLLSIDCTNGLNIKQKELKAMFDEAEYKADLTGRSLELRYQILATYPFHTNDVPSITSVTVGNKPLFNGELKRGFAMFRGDINVLFMIPLGKGLEYN